MAQGNSNIKIQRLSSRELDGTLDLLHEDFFVYENVSRAVGLPENVKARHELRQLNIAIAEEGVSIIAIDDTTKEVVGAAMNRFIIYGESSAYDAVAKSCQEPSARGILKFLSDMDELYNFQLECRVDCVFEIMFLAVSHKYRKRGIATNLVRASIELGQELARGNNLRNPISNTNLALHKTPKLIWAVFTTFISQRIGANLSFITPARKTMDALNYSRVIGNETPYVEIAYKLLRK